jgi:prophage regulatory protein
MLRITDVLAETGHRSHASIYTAIHAGLFTKPVRIGQRAVAWPSEEVKAIITARIAGKSESELREVVNELHRLRAAGQLGPLLLGENTSAPTA